MKALLAVVVFTCCACLSLQGDEPSKKQMPKAQQTTKETSVVKKDKNDVSMGDDQKDMVQPKDKSKPAKLMAVAADETQPKESKMMKDKMAKDKMNSAKEEKLLAAQEEKSSNKTPNANLLDAEKWMAAAQQDKGQTGTSSEKATVVPADKEKRTMPKKDLIAVAAKEECAAQPVKKAKAAEEKTMDKKMPEQAAKLA